jgi:hypothetical protein
MYLPGAAKLTFELPTANLKMASDISCISLMFSTPVGRGKPLMGAWCLSAVSVTSRKLQRLASLPTGTPESAGLCASGLGFIVYRSLENNSDRVW